MQIFGHILFENKTDIEITNLTEKVIHQPCILYLALKKKKPIS